MSYYRAICASVPGFSAQSDVQREASWPFDWVNEGGMPSPFGPFEMTRADVFQLLLRIKQLTAFVDWDESNGIDTRTYSFSFTMDRKTSLGVSVSDEAGLLEPFGISETFGSTAAITACSFSGGQILTDQPGPGDQVGINISIEFFRKLVLDSIQIQHLEYKASNQRWKPSVILSGGVQVDSGSEYQHDFYNYEPLIPTFPPAPTPTINASVLDGFGGDDVTVHVYSADAGGYRHTGSSISLVPTLFYQWEGRWHETTGARL